MSKTISLDPTRLEGESFEDYKKRRALVNKAIKHYKRGTVVHPALIYVPKRTKTENGTDEVMYDEKGEIIYDVYKNKPYVKEKTEKVVEKTEQSEEKPKE